MTTPSPMQVFYAPLYSAGSNGAVVATQVKVVLYNDHIRITGALVEGLRKYAGHMGSCDKWRGGDVCTCGFDEMMKGVQG